jgi:hypothetical protein
MAKSKKTAKLAATESPGARKRGQKKGNAPKQARKK